MRNCRTGLLPSLCLTLFMALFPVPVPANPSEQSEPLAVEPFKPSGPVPFASPVLAPDDMQSGLVTGGESATGVASLFSAANKARVAGDFAMAQRAYREFLLLALEQSLAKKASIAGFNLMSLYAGSNPLHDPELAVLYGKLALESMAGAAGSLQGLYLQPEGLFQESMAESLQVLGVQLLKMKRYAEAEQVLQISKQYELRELLGEKLVPEELLSLPLTEQESATYATLGLPNPSHKTSTSRVKDILKATGKAVRVKKTVDRALGLPLAEADPTALALHYFVTDTQVAILVSSPRGYFSRTISYLKKDLDRQIAAFRLTLSNRLDPRPGATVLWNVLVQPVQDILKELAPKTLVLNLTGRLRYLPFAALQDPEGRFLVQDYALVNLALGAEKLFQQGKPIRGIDALGLSEARMGQAALPGVKSEIKSIVKTDASPDGVVRGTVALDGEFTSARFRKSLKGKHNVVHVATHFKFSPGDAKKSLLYLGKGEPLSMLEIGSMDYSGLDLLTLSACETAVGGGLNEYGFEVEGLAASVLRGGARTVLGSLWQVSDQSTSFLMTEFYHQRANDALNNAQALRKAQLLLIEAPGGAFKHPFYWSAFVLSGGWI